MSDEAKRLPILIWRATLVVDVVAIGAEEAEERLAEIFEMPEQFDLVDVKIELRNLGRDEL